MRVVLDSGGVSGLAGTSDRARARREALVAAGLWPPVVPAPVLVESLTGDPRRDHAANRLLRASEIVPTSEATARVAAALRTQTGRSGSVSAVDAVVVAEAAGLQGPARVVTSDAHDIDALITVTGRPDLRSAVV